MGQVRAQVCGRKCAGAGFACRGSKTCTPELVLGAWEGDNVGLFRLLPR